jgi:hypothetical protein
VILDANKSLGRALLPRAAGGLLVAVSALAALEAFGLLRRNWLLLWPGLLLAGGLAAAGAVAAEARRQGLSARAAWDSARLRPAASLALLALAGGLGEVLRAAGALPWPAGFAWPLSLLAWGTLLLAQAASDPSAPGGARARRIGALALLAGLLRGFEAIFGIQPGAVGTGWFVVLFAAAALCLRAPGPPLTGDDK